MATKPKRTMREASEGLFQAGPVAPALHVVADPNAPQDDLGAAQEAAEQEAAERQAAEREAAEREAAEREAAEADGADAARAAQAHAAEAAEAERAAQVAAADSQRDADTLRQAAQGGGEVQTDDLLDTIAPAEPAPSPAAVPAKRSGGRPRRLASTLSYATTTVMKLQMAEPEVEEIKRLGLKSRTGNTRKVAGSDIAAAFVRAGMQIADGNLDLHGVQPGDDAELTERVRRALLAGVHAQ